MEENKTDNDLISRSALKKTITEPLDINDACKNDWYEGYYTAKNEDVMAINNAQPVEPLKVYEFKGCDNCELERPQGEILTEHCIEFNSRSSDCRSCYSKCTWFKCSKCSCAVDKDDRFCRHCGADLRSKENG